MALPVITRDDFEGWFDTPLTSFQYDKFDAYISRFTEKYTCEMLGGIACAFLKLVNSEKWRTKVFEEHSYISTRGKKPTYASATGLKRILRGFIYFEWSRDNFTPTPSGNVRMKTETSTRMPVSAQAQTAKSRYNCSVFDYNDSMIPFFEKYETFTFQCTGATIDEQVKQATLVALVDGFVEAKDTVWFKGKEYRVAGTPPHSPGIVIEIEGTESPDDFLGYWEAKPFNLAEINKMEYACY